MMRRILFILCCAALPITASAQGFEAVNKLRVIPLSGGTFEVIEARGDGARGMWCAAADYVLARIGPRPNQRLYVLSPRGPSVSGAGRIGVTFTTDPALLSVQPSQSVSVSVRIAGQSLPVQHAYRFCRDYELEIDDILFPLKRN